MRGLLGVLALILLVGCDSSVTPTPSIIPLTPSPQATIGAVATPTPTSPTPTVAPALPTATPSPTPEILVDVPKLSFKVPGSKSVKYYSVSGTSPAELLAALSKQCDNVSWICIGSKYTVRWTNRTQVATGICTIVSPRVEYTPAARLPRWSSQTQVSPELLAWWKEVAQHIASAETGLIKTLRSSDKKLPKLMSGKSCSKAKAIIKKWGKTRTAAADAFYAKEEAWQVPEYTAP